MTALACVTPNRCFYVRKLTIKWPCVRVFQHVCKDVLWVVPPNVVLAVQMTCHVVGLDTCLAGMSWFVPYLLWHICVFYANMHAFGTTMFTRLLLAGLSTVSRHKWACFGTRMCTRLLPVCACFGTLCTFCAHVCAHAFLRKYACFWYNHVYTSPAFVTW